MSRVSNMVAKYNKVPIGWSPYRGSNDENQESVIQMWQSNQKEDRTGNKKVIISVASECYLDMKYDSTTAYGLSWAGYNSVKNAYNWEPTDYCNKEDILGIEGVLWTENITNIEEMNYMIYPRLLGYAEIGWSNNENKDWQLYKERLRNNGERMSNEGINFYKSIDVWSIPKK